VPTYPDIQNYVQRRRGYILGAGAARAAGPGELGPGAVVPERIAAPRDAFR